MPDGGGELFNKAPGGSGGKESVVAKHYPEAAQPTDLPKVTQQVKVSDAWEGEGKETIQGEAGGKQDMVGNFSNTWHTHS